MTPGLGRAAAGVNAHAMLTDGSIGRKRRVEVAPPSFRPDAG